MGRISRLKINGYKRLHNIDLEMRPLMVMIGANGIGKTSFLEVFKLLQASLTGSLASKLSKMGGFSQILTKGKSGSFVKEMSFALEMDMNLPEHEPLKYELHLEEKGTAYAISSETLTQKIPNLMDPFKYIDSYYDDISYHDFNQNSPVRITPAINESNGSNPLNDQRKMNNPSWYLHKPFETSLFQVPRMVAQTEELKSTLRDSSLYYNLDVELNAPVRLPQQLKPVESPGRNGENLFPLLYNLKETAQDRYEVIIDTLKAAFPGFEGLSFPPVAAGMIAMMWKESYFSEPLYMNQLSEGMLRFLWLVSLLQSPVLPAITMIDEPEVSLHPELLSIVADLIREASRRTQLIVATHSDRLIRFLKPEEVVAMDITDDGLARITWADTLDLDDWLSEYTLDEIWRMGRLS